MLINITGGDGVGKTTQTILLGAWIEEAFGCPVRFATKGEVLDPVRYPEGRMFGCSYSELAEDIVTSMQGFSRSLFLFYLSAAQICRYPPKSGEVVLLDGYWVKNLGTEAALGIDARWLEGVGMAYPEPDVTLLLDMPPERVLPRQLAYKPYECGFAEVVNDHTFLENQRRVREALQPMAKRNGWPIIDADQDIERLQADLRRVLFPEIEARLGLREPAR
ncbi:dTMP kinase [Rhizobium johnstonii]|uniref:dTMP kinase n=1 Tax=Rhizobium johnstonii TaxID=3019933 RepID=UPI003F981049